MDANDFAARLAVMEAALAKCGKRDTRKPDEVERALPSAQSVAPKEEQAGVERALPSVESVTRKVQAEVVRIVPSVQSLVPAHEASEATDISIVLAARIDRLDLQLGVINDLLRRLITDQGKEKGPGSRWKAAGP
jgi:hypothetical protein